MLRKTWYGTVERVSVFEHSKYFCIGRRKWKEKRKKDRKKDIREIFNFFKIKILSKTLSNINQLIFMIRQFFDNFSNKNEFKYYFRSDKKEEEKNWNKGETFELYVMKRKGRLLDIEIDRLAAHVICLWSFHGRSASIYEEYTLKSLFYAYIFSTWIERLTRNDQKSFDFPVYTFRSYFCYKHGKYFLNNKNKKKN